MEADRAATPDVKARAFLEKFCQGTKSLEEIRENLKQAASVGSVALDAGLEGLADLLLEPADADEQVRVLAAAGRPGLGKAEARKFLEAVLGAMQEELRLPPL